MAVFFGFLLLLLFAFPQCSKI